MTTTNMEEVPLSPKLTNSLKSPSLRVRSPSAKSNIAISRGDDDSSVDDDRINNKMCVSDGSTITCVFNKKRLFGGSALAFVAVVVIMAVAIATTRSDGGSSNSMVSVNSNSAVGTAGVGSAADPKVAPVAPKVAPVAPAKSNFAFVTPNSVGGGYSGKSGKSGSTSCSSSDVNRSFNPLTDDLWSSGSGKSGKSGSNTCSFGSSGKSGKSGSRNFICDGWHSSGKSGKSNSRSKPSTPEIFQKTGAGCFAATPRQANAGSLSLGQEVCGQLAFYSVEEGECPINRFAGVKDFYAGEGCHVYNEYLLRVECAGDYSFFLTSKQQRFVVPTGGTVPFPRAIPYITKVPESAFSTSHSGKSGKSGGFLPNFTCPDVGSGYTVNLPSAANLFISPTTPTAVVGELVAFSFTLQPGLYEINVGSPYGIQTDQVNNLLPECNDDNEAFDYTLKVLPGTVVGNQ